MALVETKDLSLSPKKVILLFLYSCVVSTFFSLSPFIPFFFFRWPALRLFDTSKLVPPFSFLFAKRLCERQRAAFFKWKREIFLFTLRRRRRRKKKNNTWGHGGPETEIALEFENLSLSGFFNYSFPLLQNF